VFAFNFNFPNKDIIQPIMHLNWSLPISIASDKNIVQNLLPLTVNIPSYFVLSNAANNLISMSKGSVSQWSYVMTGAATVSAGLFGS